MTTTTTPALHASGVDRSTQAEAQSAHSRINIPLNLDNWRHLPEPQQELLLWFHQYCLDTKLTRDDAAEALNYDFTTVFRVLKGTYEGNWDNVCDRIRSYKRLALERGNIQRQQFCENSITRLVWGAMDYAMANNSITLIDGESRSGKTMSALQWKEAHNHGRTAYVMAPAFGGVGRLVRDIAEVIGVNRNKSIVDIHDAILRGFNRNRMLIVDEAHRLLPLDRRAVMPVKLELIRDLHDRTGCAIALISTSRLNDEITRLKYMFEQLIGRIGMPVRLPRRIKREDIQPIIQQYVSRPGEKLLTAMDEVANGMTRLAGVVETLKLASKIASKDQKTDRPRISDEHVFKALALRRAMMGELQYARKD
jgi:DNA transposition AAA+ family ATPase